MLQGTIVAFSGFVFLYEEECYEAPTDLASPRPNNSDMLESFAG
jgi:hypothetical protein